MPRKSPRRIGRTRNGRTLNGPTQLTQRSPPGRRLEKVKSWEQLSLESFFKSALTNGNDYGIFRLYNRIMERKMETTMVYSGYVRTMERQMETTNGYQCSAKLAFAPCSSAHRLLVNSFRVFGALCSGNCSSFMPVQISQRMTDSEEKKRGRAELKTELKI